MREIIRYLTPKKLELFMKIPVLLHINAHKYPGFIDNRLLCHGIWNFENSGFYKSAIKTKLFPAYIIENKGTDKPAIIGLYHIGSLGTFTQSVGSDFDYWVIINKKNFSEKRYALLEEKLDDILRYSREAYGQKITFFIMDQKDIKNNCYASFNGKETITAPKIFLKEEFYRTFLMIAGKIPVWSVLSGIEDLQKNTHLSRQGVTAQILSMYDDLIDLGHIDRIPLEDVLKGILWHICKSRSDPVKALIKATMIFSYGFGKAVHRVLLCENIRKGYLRAGLDDYGVDPYKELFDLIIEFHEREDPKELNIIKNVIFFRLCGYPDVKIPDKDTPKRLLLDKYIHTWNLSKNHVKKLLSYTSWPESEKLLLEKIFVNRLAQMYNYAMGKINGKENTFDNTMEKRNWSILRNKTKKRLRQNPNKIPGCSTYLKRRNILRLNIIKETDYWKLNILIKSDERVNQIYKHSYLLGIVGWILENQLYDRHRAAITFDTGLSLFKEGNRVTDIDKMYMDFQPLKPLSDSIYVQDASWSKMMILLSYYQSTIKKAEFLASNTWGELFLYTIKFTRELDRQDKCRQMATVMMENSCQNTNFFIYQLAGAHDTEIVYQIKKTYNDLAIFDKNITSIKKKPYLDKL